MKKDNIKYIVFAFVLGLAIAVGCSVKGALLMGSKGIILTPMPDPSIGTPIMVTTPQIKEEPAIAPSEYSQVVTKEEARLRSIEARLKALEAKTK